MYVVVRVRACTVRWRTVPTPLLIRNIQRVKEVFPLFPGITHTNMRDASYMIGCKLC